MKQQFDLSVWLQDKSRKIVTRDGKSVRIVCWDLKCNTPIIAAIQWNQEREDCYCYNTKGWCANNEGELDLFFADDKEELTEFEKEILNLLNCATPEGHGSPTIEKTKEYSQKLIDLARKELQPEFDKEMDKMLAETDKVVYQKGREDALKSLDKREMVSEDLEEACDNYYDETWDEHGGIAMVVNNCHDIWFPSQATSDFFKAGSEWQKKKDQETIELAEDHAMLAGMNRMKEEMMKDAVIAWVNTYESVTNPYDNEVSFITNLSPSKFKNKEMVKIIIVNEDEK